MREQRRKSRRSRKIANLVLNIVWVVAFVTFVVCAGVLGWYGWRSGTEKAANNALAQTVEAAVQSKLDTNATPLTLQQKRLEAYQALAQKNSDMVGWLTIAGTNVNYPVMHTPKTPQYYLRRGFDKQYAMSGTPFLDALCDIQTVGDNKIIYGHNMKDKTMFFVVESYTKQSYYAEHRVLFLDTLTQQHEYEVFAVLKIDTSYDNPDALAAYQRLTAADAPAQQAYIDYLTQNRLYDTGVTATAGDTLVTLSTCDNITDAGRIVVVARRKK